MISNNSAILNQITHKRSEYVGFCRFLSNPKISFDKLITGALASTSGLVEGKEILVLNDTTELNYQHHLNFYTEGDSDLGPTGNNKDIGFFLHPGYVIDADTGIGLGFSYINIWNRKFDKLDKQQRDYRQQPIEEKESYRWIECGHVSKKQLSKAKHITIIADRESDIYDEFVKVPDKKTDLIIRSCRERNLYEEKEKLHEKISSSECKGTYLLDIRQQKARKSRLATIEVRFERVKLKRPGNAVDKTLPSFIELTIVQAKEQTSSVPGDEPPVNWVLLTTLTVEDLGQAMDVIKKYKYRWEIEILFATMKSKGLKVELSQLETGKSLKALCVFALISSLRIMQLRQARETGENISATIAFTKGEIALITILIKEYEGKTKKQKNPFKELSMAWAAWLIARIGGWKGYKSESPPGYKTFTIGLTRFDSIYEGFKLSNEMCA